MSQPGIEFRQVSKRYGAADAPLVVQGISFAVQRGTLTTLLGLSSFGKITTLRLVAGLESPSDGQVLIDGQDVTTLGPAERNVSMVFQSYALFPHMSVIENVGYGLSVAGVSRESTRQRAQGALATVGLTGLDGRLPSALSGGQQQRVAVARELAIEPSVLLFDEPLSNLDARSRRSMREEVRALQQRQGLTVAFVTHDQAEALAVSDQVIVMAGGRIAQAGSPQTLYERPKSASVAGFMGEALLLPAQAHADGTVQLGPLRLQPAHAHAHAQAFALPPGPAQVAVRPEAWLLGPAGGPGQAGTVSKSAYLGSACELTLVTALGPIFVVTPDTQRTWRAGYATSLSLGPRGHSVVAG